MEAKLGSNQRKVVPGSVFDACSVLFPFLYWIFEMFQFFQTIMIISLGIRQTFGLFYFALRVLTELEDLERVVRVYVVLVQNDTFIRFQFQDFNI